MSKITQLTIALRSTRQNTLPTMAAAEDEETAELEDTVSQAPEDQLSSLLEEMQTILGHRPDVKNLLEVDARAIVAELYCLHDVLQFAFEQADFDGESYKVVSSLEGRGSTIKTWKIADVRRAMGIFAYEFKRMKESLADKTQRLNDANKTLGVQGAALLEANEELRIYRAADRRGELILNSPERAKLMYGVVAVEEVTGVARKKLEDPEGFIKIGMRYLVRKKGLYGLTTNQAQALRVRKSTYKRTIQTAMENPIKADVAVTLQQSRKLIHFVSA